MHEALGGASRTVIPVYNTCSGYSFNAGSSAYNSGATRRVITVVDEMRGPYDDQIAFTRDAGKLAESYNIPIAPHDCIGPVLLWAGLHLALHTPSGLFQEVVRANLATWYQDIATCLPEIRDGAAQMPAAPGLGMELRPEVMERKDSIIKESTREEFHE